MSEGWAHKHCKTPVVHKKDIKCFREEGRRGILGQGEKEVKKRCEGIVKRCGGESQARWRQLWKAVSLSPQIKEQVIPPIHVCWTVNSRSRAGRSNCLPFCQYLKRARQMSKYGLGRKRRRRQKRWLLQTGWARAEGNVSGEVEKLDSDGMEEL